MLRPGFTLPPLMFSEEEIEALALGSRWVVDRADARLALAARNALAKIAAVLPAARRDDLDATTLLVGPGEAAARDSIDLADLRQAIRAERKVTLTYRDKSSQATGRTIWPFAQTFFDRVRVVVAWCELRDGFRHFRTDRIEGMNPTAERYPRRRRALLKAWRDAECLPPLP